MIIINECRVDDEGKCLVIEATVDSLSYYDDVYIESIVIDNDETYLASGYSANPVYEKQFEQTKHIRIKIPERDLRDSNLNNNIFFVYLIATGYPSPDCPCGEDSCYTMSIAVNLRPIYNAAMSYIKELNIECSTPKGFTDMILRLKAFDLALRTGNYPIAINQWNTLFKKRVNVSSRKGCGCHGIN